MPRDGKDQKALSVNELLFLSPMEQLFCYTSNSSTVDDAEQNCVPKVSPNQRPIAVRAPPPKNCERVIENLKRTERGNGALTIPY
jgi:hypothetical protein